MKAYSRDDVQFNRTVGILPILLRELHLFLRPRQVRVPAREQAGVNRPPVEPQNTGRPGLLSSITRHSESNLPRVRCFCSAALARPLSIRFRT